MKRSLSIFIMLSFVIGNLWAADIDVTKKPEPLKEKEFPFPEYTVKTMDNGMKIFIIEDHEQPTVTFRMMIGGGSSKDGDHAGTSDMVAGLLTKGAGDMTALEIAEKLDGVGASINAGSNADYMTVSAAALTKHIDLLLDIYSQVVLSPTFPEDEMDKLMKQTLTGLQYEKSQASTIAQKMARKVVYGMNHPYANDATIKTVEGIEHDHIEKYYNDLFHPNNASLAIVGDVDPDEIMEKINQYFGKWEKKPFPSLKVPGPNPMPQGVYFIERPGSIQSSVILTTVAIPQSNKDYDCLSLAGSVIGAGFAGRLFRTVREEHSYTYTPFGFVTSSKYANRFACGADVRNSVTDSTIDVIKEQLYLLAREPATEEELNRVKQTKVGGYLMNFENSNFIASVIQNADFMEIPISEVKKAPQKIMNMTPYEIKNVAMKYMNPDNAYIVVVGSSDVREKLEKYGKVYDYNLDIEPANANLEKISMDCDDLIESYIEAIGGEEAIKKINTICKKGDVSFTMGETNLKGKVEMNQKASNKEMQMMDLGFMKQMQWIDGKNCWVQTPQGNVEKKEGKESQELLEEATFMLETRFLELGYQCNVIGKKGSEILMKTTSPLGNEKTYYFDGSTFLITKVESVEHSPQGVIPMTEYRQDYKAFSGVLMPTKVKTESPQFTIEANITYEMNKQMDDSLFQPETKQ
jgi:zinc protease